MDRLVTVADVAERYRCSRQTARKYIRQCNPHMEKPLVTTEEAFADWELMRLVVKNRISTMELGKEIMRKKDRVIVPRRR